MSSQNISKGIITYLLIVFAISTILYILIPLSGGLEGGGELLALPLMWSPAIAGLLTTFIYRRNFRGMGWGLCRSRFFLIAYLIPVIYALVAYGVVWFAGLGRLDLMALGENPGMEIVIGMTVGILEAALLALGEEIGWRGFLVPQVAKLTTFTRTALITGVIWGIWHVPLIINGGYSSNAPTWYAIACFMVLVVGISFVFTWLRLASGSLWPAVLLHAVHNHIIQGILDKITVDTGNTQYFTTEFGLGLALMGIIVGLVFWRLGKNLDVNTQPVNSSAQVVGAGD